MTEYSFMESSIKLDDYISFAKNNGLEYLAITERNSFYSLPSFLEKTKKNNIKAIIGVDIDVENFRVILIARNYGGYKKISELISKLDAGLKLKDLIHKDVIVIDHPVYGSYQTTGHHLDLYDFYSVNHPKITNRVNVPYVKMLTPEDKDNMDLINKLSQSKEKRYDFYPVEVEPDNVGWLNVQTLIESLDYDYINVETKIPTFEKGKDSNATFLKLLKKGIVKRKNNLEKDAEEYTKRLRKEIAVISKLGFQDYFLIIQDFVNWAKDNDIYVGPGRGSAAGSLVSYILGITDVDPLKYDLLFERFLNEERVSLPDIDLDIEDTRRSEVLDYVFEKYGLDHVAQISAFQRMGPKTAIRDIARLEGMNMGEVNEFSKKIGFAQTLKDAYKDVPAFKAMVNRNPKNVDIFKRALSIETLPRQLGTHAAGIVISDEPIHEYMPTVEVRERKQVQFTMNHLEEYGLVKIDILGLRNLSIIHEMQNQIFAKYNKKLNLNAIPLNDKKTLQLLSNADTHGIFQLESRGMKQTLRQVGVHSFDDIVAIISLFRPGPMKFIDSYAKRKQGKEKLQSISKEYDEITKATYGIIVYQEQIMQIAQSFAGLSFGQADILRRAISKKDINKMESLKSDFFNGAISKGQSRDKIVKVFEMIELFAEYGFNKSHAVAYSLISYRLAYLKANFPVQFYTTMIKFASGSVETTESYINEAKEKGISVMTVNINVSKSEIFYKNNTIILPLSLVKGLGAKRYAEIDEERARNGKYKSFFDFIVRMKVIKIDESSIKSLIWSGALDEYGNMISLLDSLPVASIYAKNVVQTDKNGNMKIDEEMKEILAEPILIDSKINFMRCVRLEKQAIGFNMNYFETQGFEGKVKLKDLKMKQRSEITVFVKSMREFNMKNGEKGASIIVRDSTLEVRMVAFSNVYKFAKIDGDNIVVRATIEKDTYRGEPSYRLLTPWKVIDHEK